MFDAALTQALHIPEPNVTVGWVLVCAFPFVALYMLFFVDEEDIEGDSCRDVSVEQS